MLMLASSLTYGQLFEVSQCLAVGGTSYGPMHSVATANATSRHATIYPASQLAGIVGEELTAIYFDRDNATGALTGSPLFKVYLKEVTQSDWGAGALDWATAIDGATLVYDSNPAAAIGTNAGWKNFVFSTAFTYSGAANLAVMMEYTNPSAGTTVNWSYEFQSPCISTTNSNTSKHSVNTSGALSSTLGTSNYRRPWIAFDYFILCPSVTNLTASTLTSSAINVTWTAGGTETQWEYALVPTGDPAPTAGTIVSSPAADIAGLTPQTSYTLYVRALCADDEVSTWKTYAFTTLCAPVSALPWIENFDALTTLGANAFPSCWVKQNGDWATSNAIERNRPRSGANYLRNSWTATNEFIWTPFFELEAGVSYDFSTFVQGDNYTGWVVDMFYNTAQSSTDATQFGASYTVPGASASGPATILSYDEMRRTFTPTTSGTYTFALRVNQPSGSPYYVAFDDMKVEETSACAAPTQITATASTYQSAVVTWTNSAAAASYNIEYGPVGFVPGTGTVVSNVTSPATVTGLDGATLYLFYVHAVCADETNLGGPAFATTPCGPETAPTVLQQFDTYVPVCWSEATGTLGASSTLTVGTSVWSAAPGFGNTGTNKAARINLYGGTATTPDNDWLISHPIDLGTSPNNFQLSYNVAVTSYSGTTAPATLGTHVVRVVISTDDGATWSTTNVLKTYTGAGTYSNTGNTEFISLSDYTGVIRIGFLATTTSSSPDLYFFVDDFVITELSACAAPTSITATATTDNSTVLNWTELGTATSWSVEYGPQGFEAGSGTTVVVTSLPFALTGLQSATQYQVAVAAICDGEVGDYSTRISFTTLPEAPANDNCSGAIEIEVNNDLNCTNVTSGTTFGATLSMPASGAPCFGNPDDDVWFSFVATATTHKFALSNITATSGSSTDLYLQVFSGTCDGGLNSVVCIDPNTGNIPGLTVGETYFIRVYTYYATSTASFDLCLTTDPSLSTGTFELGKFAYSPNPVRDVLTITNAASINEVTLFNMLGQQVMVQKPNLSTTTLDMSALPSGAYIVKASTNDATETFKIQKM